MNNPTGICVLDSATEQTSLKEPALIVIEDDISINFFNGSLAVLSESEVTFGSSLFKGS